MYLDGKTPTESWNTETGPSFYVLWWFVEINFDESQPKKVTSAFFVKNGEFIFKSWVMS